MAVNKDNLEFGAGSMTLQYANDIAPVDIGGCSNAGMEIKTEDIDVDVDQYLDPLDNFIVGRVITFSVDMKEDTLRNLVIASGGDPDDIDTEEDPEKEIYHFPASSVQSSPFAELIYKVARIKNKSKYKTVILYKVKNQGGVNFKYEKKKERFYSVKFQAYADAAHDGKPGKVEYEKLTA